MEMEKLNKKRKWWNLVIACVFYFFTIDYFLLIQHGDDTLRRKIVLAIWIMGSVFWTFTWIKEFFLRKGKEKK